MKAGEGQHPPRDPGLHLVPGTYEPPPERQIDAEFVGEVVINLMKPYNIDPLDAEEMVDRMTDAWAARAETDPRFLRLEGLVVAFLKTAMRRDYIDLVDKRRRREKAQPKLLVDTQNRLTVIDPYTRLETEERRGAVNRAIERLPEMRRRVCSLHFLEEMEMKEIAELLGISLRTVDKHIQLGVRDLRRMLSEYDQRGPRKEQA